MGANFLSTLKKTYNNSLYKMLSDTYTMYDWLPWKFLRAPPNFWEDLKNQRKFLDWAGKELNYKETDDWYNITVEVTFICY